MTENIFFFFFFLLVETDHILKNYRIFVTNQKLYIASKNAPSMKLLIYDNSSLSMKFSAYEKSALSLKYPVFEISSLYFFIHKTFFYEMSQHHFIVTLNSAEYAQF